MTIQLPPYKVRKVLKGYLSGKPQTRIAAEAEVDQATVSHYASRFKKTAAQKGIQAAGKEYGVLSEVDELRSLSVEINKSRLSVEDARKGHDIVRTFLKLGIKPEAHQALVKVCQQVGDPAFVHAAVNLVQIESQTGVSYHEVISRCEQAQRNLPVTETKLAHLQAELRSVSDEISKTKRALVDQRKELERYQAKVKTEVRELSAKLTAKMAQVAIKEKEVEDATVLRSTLAQKGLNLKTLVKLAQEFGQGRRGETNAVDSARLNEALEEFGLLKKANKNLKGQNESLTARNKQLEEDYLKLATRRAALAKGVERSEAQERDVEHRLGERSEKLEALGNQYQLFCGFAAMVNGSPSVTESTGILIALFQQLKDDGWYVSQSPEEMRGLFIRVTMGDHLKCFRCDYCGSKFITNGKPGNKSWGKHYVCPVCQFTSSVKADDSFLKALVAGKRLEDIQLVEELLKENEVLRPFRAFLSASCAICHQPVTEWDDSSVQLAIEGIGCGHTACWNTELGRLRMFGKAFEKVIRKRE